MADERLTDQAAFAGTEIQDTDLFWIEVDNGDTTFSDYKITGLQLKSLLPTLYTDDGEIDVPRTVDVDDSTGVLTFQSTKTSVVIHPNYVQIRHFDSGAATAVRTINLNASYMAIVSDYIQYTLCQVYSKELATISDTPEVIHSCVPVTASNFAVTAEVKGFQTGTNAFHYTKITATYKLVAGVATIVGAAEIYNPAAAGMAVDLVPNGTNVDVQVTGVSANIVNWKAIIKVF